MGIEPMLLTEVDDESVLDRKDRIFQIKRNGVRMVANVKDHKIVGLFNRTGAPCLALFPELKDQTLSINEGILDGEIVVEREGKDVFYSGIDQRRSIPSKKDMEENPILFVVFDALRVNGEVLLMKPYKDRYDRLLKNLQPTDKVKIIDNYPDGRGLWSLIKERDYEGIVIKNPMAIYEVGKRSKDYLKLKNYKFVEVKVEKTEPNTHGTKIFGKGVVQGIEIPVEAQMAGIFDIAIGDVRRIKYLDFTGTRIIQPTRS